MQTDYFTTKMQVQSPKLKLILASSSPYRKMQLEQLQLEFSVLSPDIDESSMDRESPELLVARLARQKAQTVADIHPAAIVIGSDQLAVFEGRVIGKPGTEENSVRQLQQFSGSCVQFLTAVRICCSDSGFDAGSVVVTDVHFRVLTEEEIRRYVEMDQPFDCAGGFRSEAAGSALLKSMCSDDPSAIIGLPLITVSRLLREAGFSLP